MESLPPEILRRLVSHLTTEYAYTTGISESIPRTPLATYACISRKWQRAVEPIVCRTLRLTPARLDVAKAYGYLQSTRLAYMRHIYFNIEFPGHDLHVSTNAEDYDDQVFFNEAMGQLLSLLAQAPRREIPLIDLILSISSPREYCIPWDSYAESEENQVLSGKVRKKYLELSEGWDIGIPALSEVSYFKISLDSRALLFAPATINLMASRMARLRKVEWTLDDAEKLDSEIRIAQRTAFARTLTSLPSSIEEFRLEYIREPPRDRTFRPASILPHDARGDILSQELRQLSQRLGLREFLVQASVDTTILWPSSQDMECKPTWPTLELLRVEINDVLPSGEWVEIRDPEDSDDELAEDTEEDERLESEVPGEEHGRRFNPIFNPVHFDQFALAVARAASQTPKIEEMYLAYQGYAPMSIGFVTRDCFTWKRKRKPHLEFCGDTASIMHPSTETMEAWRGTLAQHNLEWNVHFADNGSQYHIADF